MVNDSISYKESCIICNISNTHYSCRRGRNLYMCNGNRDWIMVGHIDRNRCNTQVDIRWKTIIDRRRSLNGTINHTNNYHWQSSTLILHIRKRDYNHLQCLLRAIGRNHIRSLHLSLLLACEWELQCWDKNPGLNHFLHNLHFNSFSVHTTTP